MYRLIGYNMKFLSNDQKVIIKKMKKYGFIPTGLQPCVVIRAKENKGYITVDGSILWEYWKGKKIRDKNYEKQKRQHREGIANYCW